MERQAGRAQGTANGSRGTRILESITFHAGLGVLIAALAAYALPGALLVRRRGVTPATAAGAPAAADAPAERTVARERAVDGRDAVQREPAVDGDRVDGDREV